MTAVAPPHQVGGEPEVGEQAGVVPQRARGDGDRRGQLGEQRPEVGRRDPVGVVVEVGEHPGAGGDEPRLPVGGDAGLLHVLGDPAALGAGDPLRRAPPGGGQQVAGEDEEGAPHGQLLDQGAVVVQRPVDVGPGDAVDARVDGEVGRRRLRRVQDRHRAGGRHRVGHPVLRGDPVPAGHPGASLRVGDETDRRAQGVAPRSHRDAVEAARTGRRRRAPAARPRPARAPCACAAAGRGRPGPAGTERQAVAECASPMYCPVVTNTITSRTTGPSAMPSRKPGASWRTKVRLAVPEPGPDGQRGPGHGHHEPDVGQAQRALAARREEPEAVDSTSWGGRAPSTT